MNVHVNVNPRLDHIPADFERTRALLADPVAYAAHMAEAHGRQQADAAKTREFWQAEENRRLGPIREACASARLAYLKMFDGSPITPAR